MYIFLFDLRLHQQNACIISVASRSVRICQSYDKQKKLSCRYSLNSSCCNTDFQSHPRSIIFISFKKAY